MDALRTAIGIVIAMSVFSLMIWLAHKVFANDSRNLEQHRQEARAQFTAWQSTPAAAQLQLAADQCEVVQESETMYKDRDWNGVSTYTLTRFMRNPAGDYFMFKSTPRGPYVKPVEAKIARIVLKDKFIAPA